LRSFSIARSVSTVHIWKPASLSASTLGIFKGRAAEKHQHGFLSDEELDTCLLEAVVQSVKQVLKHRGLDAPWATILAESSIREEMQASRSDRYVDSQRR
jgi:hypothetical protein